LVHPAGSNAFAPVLYATSSRQLKQLASGVFCNFDSNKQQSGWKNFLFANGALT
jgi:hypothetical protein